MAVQVCSVVSLVNFRNYLGVVIGTWYILADLYWLVCDDIGSKELEEAIQKNVCLG